MESSLISRIESVLRTMRLANPFYAKWGDPNANYPLIGYVVVDSKIKYTVFYGIANKQTQLKTPDNELFLGFDGNGSTVESFQDENTVDVREMWFHNKTSVRITKTNCMDQFIQFIQFVKFNV